jgi:hypothetical protein
MVYVTVRLLHGAGLPSIAISPHRRGGGRIPAGGVYRVAVTPGDVGARVTLRHAVADGVSDVVGELLSWTSGVLSVRRRDGSVVEVAESSLVAARVVPS